MFEMTTAQHVRIVAMELVVEHYKKSSVHGARPTPEWLIGKAKPIEKYVLFGNDKEAARAEGY